MVGRRLEGGARVGLDELALDRPREAGGQGKLVAEGVRSCGTGRWPAAQDGRANSSRGEPIEAAIGFTADEPFGLLLREYAAETLMASHPSP